MQRKHRNYLLLLLGVLVIGFLVFESFSKFRNTSIVGGFSWSQVVSSVQQARLSDLLIGMAIIFVCYAIRALRWGRFSRTIGPSNFWSVYAATLMGFSCVFLLGRAGEPVRPVLISRKEKLSMPGMFGVYLLERIFDVAASVVLAVVALLLFEKHGASTAEGSHLITLARSTGAVLFAGLLGAVIFLVYFRLHGSEWLSRRLQHPAWRTGFRARLAALLEGFSDGLKAVRTWGDLAVLLGYTAAHWFLVVLVYYFVERAFGGDLAAISLGGTVLVLAFTLVGSAVQLPVAGGGAQVATFFVVTAAFDVAREPAATFAVIVWLVSFASCCLAGIPLLFREGLSMSDLRRISREEERESEAELLAEAERAAHVEDTTR
jgi:glycosyltransferase 2 family protein